MLRLIIALGVAAALIPEDVHFQPSETSGEMQVQANVSAMDTLSAANSLYQDVTGFCERNEEACITGKMLALNLATQARSALNTIGGSKETPQTDIVKDDVVTGSVLPPVE